MKAHLSLQWKDISNRENRLNSAGVLDSSEVGTDSCTAVDCLATQLLKLFSVVS